MIPYKVKSKEVSGTNLGEVYKSAYRVFHEIEKHTKRRPYLRSLYFNKEKIFFNYFWDHLKQKDPKTRYKRLKLFTPAIEVIKYSRNIPSVKINPNNKKEKLYRFGGQTRNQIFIVQIKENLKNKKKDFMSCFPIE